MMAVNFGKNLQDTAPLSQLLAIGLLAYTMVLLSRRWYAPLPGTLLVPCLGLAILPPFLLENLSYHFDAVTMMLALCLGLSCYALPEEWSRRGRFLYGVAATFLVLGLYQAAIGAYLSMVFVEIVCTRGGAYGGAWQNASVHCSWRGLYIKSCVPSSCILMLIPVRMRRWCSP